MNTKLTLVLNDSIISEIKKYAKKSHTTLSNLVETYFLALISTKSDAKIAKTPPLTKALTGIVKTKSKKSYKELLKEALIKKAQ